MAAVSDSGEMYVYVTVVRRVGWGGVGRGADIGPTRGAEI